MRINSSNGKPSDIKSEGFVFINEVTQKDSGKSLGWIAMPEIQLRQTVHDKQEYIMSNCNSSIEEAVRECLIKMDITEGKEVFYPTDFEERHNRLWE